MVLILRCFPNNPKLSRSDFHSCLFTRARDHLAEELRQDPSTVNRQERRAHLPWPPQIPHRRSELSTLNLTHIVRGAFGNSADPQKRTSVKSHQECVRVGALRGVKVRQKDARDLSQSADGFHTRSLGSSVGCVLRHGAASSSSSRADKAGGSTLAGWGGSERVS